ncbi:major facilitator superfamily domain-containing protein [Pisolithus marmoratus]|nr:major facilitator superfamily domain-containing protein [Pisolithus marmoratus]
MASLEHSLPSVLTRQYPESQFGTQYYSKLVASIAFAGKLDSTCSMPPRVVVAAILVIMFSLVSGGLIGAGFDIGVTVIWTCCIRFFLGMTTCAEHPCGRFCTSEQAEEDRIAKNAHPWRLVLGTNTVIDMGFVMAAFAPLVLYWTHGETHFGTIWNGSLALGTVPAFFLLLFSAKELDYCRCKHSVPVVRIPFRIALRRYWKNLLGLSLAWFLYDFITYPLGIYASTITNNNSSLSIVFGWSVVIDLFYIPGAVAGTVLIDVVSPKTVMIIGLLLQAAMGFIMGALLSPLTSHVALFAVPYGIFLSLGEFGPGSCLRVLAAKIGPTAICRQYGGMAVAIGKVGAFIGMWAFGGLKTAKGITGPFWTCGGLAVLSALVTTFLVKSLTHDGAKFQDKAFRQYLEENGFDDNLLDVPINTPNSRNTQTRINESSAA